jgi:hypothetical protein
MNTLFDVNQYWLKRGPTYIGEERLGLEYHPCSGACSIRRAPVSRTRRSVWFTGKCECLLVSHWLQAFRL